MDDKHLWMAETFLPKETNVKRKNVEAVKYQKVTRNTKLVMCILGCWAVYFPPYNIARLTALTREAGYYTKVFDFNVESYHTLNIDKAWDAVNQHWWNSDEYYDRIHPTYKPILDQYVKQILEQNPSVVGFSLYDTNVRPTEYISQEIKRVNPNIIIICGGPQCHSPTYIPHESIDYYVAGEGEQVLIDFLNNVENNISIETRKLGSTYSDVRIDIDSLPMPDYSDYDFSKYTRSYGISSELSRGCVAKCSFCKETWFWKYRDRNTKSVLDEIEHQYKTYGTNFIWFIDSLTNGNIKELRRFAKGVVERGLDIKWMGYARNDGRMDYEYFKDLKASGCTAFSYGIESGSQKVLDLMRKNVKVSEINENLINGRKVGIYSHANWVVGAPGEDVQAAAHSLNLIWNNRNRINGISTGFTLNDHPQTDYEFNRHRYNMSPPDKTFDGKWWSLDWSNAKLHRLIRMKFLNIWLNVCREHGRIENLYNRPTIKNDYKLKFDVPDYHVDEVEYEDINHLLMKPDFNTFADTSVNEIWGFARMLWRVKGAFEFELEFDPVKDLETFGQFIAVNYSAKHYIKIDVEGNFTASHNMKYIHNGEWWMTGTRSFEYNWNGTGKLNASECIINEYTSTGSTDVATYNLDDVRNVIWIKNTP